MTDVYKKTIWISETTKVSPTNLNKIEDGIKNATDGVIELEAETLNISNNVNDLNISVKENTEAISKISTDITSLSTKIDSLSVTVKIDGGEIV